jgi:hypothetical protein
VEVAAHHRGDDGEQRADDEGNPPAPGANLIGRQEDILQSEEDENRAQLSADQRHILEARIEAAMPLVGNLGQVGGARAVFSAQAEPLNDAGERQEEWRGKTDRLVRRRHCDHQRTEAHRRHGQHQGVAAAPPVGKPAEQPPTHRPHEEGGREQERGVELLHDGILRREERGCEI